MAGTAMLLCYYFCYVRVRPAASQSRVSPSALPLVSCCCCCCSACARAAAARRSGEGLKLRAGLLSSLTVASPARLPAFLSLTSHRHRSPLEDHVPGYYQFLSLTARYPLLNSANRSTQTTKRLHCSCTLTKKACFFACPKGVQQELISKKV